jgi:hypothetical protein
VIEAIAIAAAALGVAAALTTAFLNALSQAKGRREEAVGRAKAEALATALSTQLTDSINREQEQKQRADRLDDAYAKMLADIAAMPATGAFSRLLAIVSAAKAHGSEGPRELSPPSGADARPDSGLLDPFADGQ